MSAGHVYGFGDKLAESSSPETNEAMRALLLRSIVGARTAYRGTVEDDRRGVDWWVERDRGRRIGIDLKRRNEDWAARGCDDLALERWSNIERGVPGWTLRETSIADLVVWWWRDTGRSCFVPFPPLCRAFRACLDLWQRYERPPQYTPDGGYHSQAWMVPRALVEAATDAALRSDELGDALRADGPQLPPYWRGEQGALQVGWQRRMLLVARRSGVLASDAEPSLIALCPEAALASSAMAVCRDPAHHGLWVPRQADWIWRCVSCWPEQDARGGRGATPAALEQWLATTQAQTATYLAQAEELLDRPPPSEEAPF